MFIYLFIYFLYFRTKWKRQTAVGLEYFVEGNYAAYQRAYAARYGQMDLSSYAANPLMMPGAGQLMPPSNLPSVESYYQQILQNGMNGLPTAAHANLFATPHRPLPIMPGTTGFLPLSQPNNLYPASRLTQISSPPSQHHSPEHPRPNSLSPVAASPSLHSPKSTQQPWTAKAQSTTTTTTNNASDNESDIEV